MSDIRKAIMERLGAVAEGEKAVFAADAGSVAKEILRQLGGGRFMSMVGGKNAFHGNFGGKPGLQVDIGKGAQGGINRLIVTLDPATDTYDMEFWRIANRGLSTKKVSEAHGVYADDLQRVFTDRTKFYTSMSRPGAKAAFSAAQGWIANTQIGREFGIEIAQELGRNVKSLTDGEIDRGLEWLAKVYEMEGHDLRAINKALASWIKYESAAKRGQVKSSRPGAKAKMDKSAALAIVGKAVSSVPAGPQRDALQKALIDYYDNTQASNRLLQQGKLTDATRFDVEAGRAVQIAIRVWDRMGKPAAELRGYTQNLERAAEFSRPGAKAKMARWEESHAEGWGDLSKTLTATINGTRWTIVVDASTGKGQLMRSTGRGPQVVKEGAVDQLKRYAETARASRPGAKAKMGFVGTAGQAGAIAARGMRDGAAAYRDGKPAVLNRLNPKYHGWSDKDLEVYGNFWMRGWTGEQMKEMRTRDPKQGIDLPGFRSSRPGAKIANALSDACWQGYEAVGTKEQDGKTVPNCVPKETAAKPDDTEREDVKAGLKLMEKADQAVSDKIRTLIKEGKPQDQAVAIALDMKRRGEL